MGFVACNIAVFAAPIGPYLECSELRFIDIGFFIARSRAIIFIAIVIKGAGSFGFAILAENRVELRDMKTHRRGIERVDHQTLRAGTRSLHFLSARGA